MPDVYEFLEAERIKYAIRLPANDLASGSAPALPDAVAAPAMRFDGELLGIVAQHLLDRSNPDRQTKALEGAMPSSTIFRQECHHDHYVVPAVSTHETDWVG